jgi:phosphate transport system substrate-binding protein
VHRLKTLVALVAAVALALTVVACGGDDDNGGGGGGGSAEGGGQNLSGTIRADGSSTVAPLTEAAAELFREENPEVRISVGTSGTGGGFEKFCRGETDISDASREIKDEEIEICEKNGVKYEQLVVANDALAVVLNPENDWASCMTTDQLKQIWNKGSDVKTWKDVDPSWPDEEIKLYGPGTDSGTFDYFTEAINGEEGVQRTDYNNIGEDDNATITGVSGDKNAMGYLGFSFVQENEGKVKAAEVDGGSGCVAPTAETAQDGSYKPLGRELYIYISDKAIKRPEVKAFADFYIQNATPVAEQAQYIPLTEEQVQQSQQKVDSLGGQ